MRILGLDTATLTASVAIVDETGHALGDGARTTAGRSADLLVAIDDVCRAAGVAPRELTAIAVGAGPGSFTGLRIGMATAKGIAFAAARPLWAVSSLAAVAHGYPLVVAALDARRGEVYAGCYRDGELLAPERTVAPGEARRVGRDVRRRSIRRRCTRELSAARVARVAHRDALGRRRRTGRTRRCARGCPGRGCAELRAPIGGRGEVS